MIYKLISEGATSVEFRYYAKDDQVEVRSEDKILTKVIYFKANEFIRIARLLQNDRDASERFPKTYPEEEGI